MLCANATTLARCSTTPEATAADALSVAVRRMCVLSAHRIAAHVRLVVPSFPELHGEDERLSHGGKDGLVYCSSDLTDAETR